jgi:hypothetical protein
MSVSTSWANSELEQRILGQIFGSSEVYLRVAQVGRRRVEKRLFGKEWVNTLLRAK